MKANSLHLLHRCLRTLNTTQRGAFRSSPMLACTLPSLESLLERTERFINLSVLQDSGFLSASRIQALRQKQSTLVRDVRGALRSVELAFDDGSDTRSRRVG